MRALVIATALAFTGAATIVAAAPPPSAVHGKQLFQQCAACHNLTGQASLGPDLRGVVGNKAAARKDYRYSPALMRSGITWNDATLNAFLANPQQSVRGNKMPYAGMKDARDRADLIAHLRTLK